MDPNKAFAEWKGATDDDERRTYGLALASWLEGGGFAPRWTPAAAGSFFAWVDDERRRGSDA